MKRSTERILTTHAGSLARPADLREMVRAKDAGQPYDHEAFAVRVRTAVAEVVQQQLDCGIDVVSEPSSISRPCSMSFFPGRRAGRVDHC